MARRRAHDSQGSRRDILRAAREVRPIGPRACPTQYLSAKGGKPFNFPADLVLDRFYGTVTIRFEHGKVTHVETETRRAWQYKDLPEHALPSVALKQPPQAGQGAQS